MAQVTPAQTSFNGGEISRRLQARRDQSLYGIAVAEMVGFSALVEGPAEAMPGTIHVLAAPGPCRLVQFEYSTTQGHVLEFSHELVRVFTNDALIATVASPYSWAEAQRLTFHQSYDVLYCFHPEKQTREFYRTGPDTFLFSLVEFIDGPFEPRNRDEAKTVFASGVEGAVTLEASAGIFAATDVGSLFRMEVKDLGDITAWEPYVTVTQGQFLAANDRVYRVVGGNPDVDGLIRTGTLTPVHTEGVEWDGIAKGTDINGAPAGGVRLEYIHDRYGVLRISAFTDASHVTAQVLRRLPFSSTTGASYGYDGGYYDPVYDIYVPPETTVAYTYGTYRWSFGAFSDTRGHPAAGAVWDERLCLAKGSTVYCSVRGDFGSHSELNEAGEASNDMAVIAILQDPNAVRALVAAERLLALTSAGVHALGPNNAAAGFGPSNAGARKQNDAGSAVAQPIELDSRTLHIDRSSRRIYETDLDPGRQVEQPIDLTRYARHIGKAGFVEIATQQHPFNHLWAACGDGTLALAAYLPEEQVLAFSRRQLAPGMAARSICTITDPAGEFDQVWIAAEYAGTWHVLRMAPWRQDGDNEATACMVDMAALYEGDPVATLTHPVLADTDLQVVADGAFYEVRSNAARQFTLPEPASKVWAGLAFPAWIESLDFEMGGDNGSAAARKARFGRAWIDLEEAQGLSFGVPGNLQDLEQLRDDSETDEGFASFTGYAFRESVGDWTRHPRLRVERVAPFQATVKAWGGEMDMQGH